MTKRPTHVPKFGNWDANDHVPFTVVFENARVGKGGGKMINPNDPSENPEAFGLTSDQSKDEPPIRTPTKRSQQQRAEETSLPSQFSNERNDSKEEDDRDWPPRNQHVGLSSHRLLVDAQRLPRLGGSERHTRPTAAGRFRKSSPDDGVRQNNGVEYQMRSNQAADESPNYQPTYEGQLGNRPDRKVPPEALTVFAPPDTPGRYRHHGGSISGDDTPDGSPALPKFGAWDERDPSSGDGFTVIFNQAHNEKKVGGPVRIPALKTESPVRMDQTPTPKRPQLSQQKYGTQKKASSWACCFAPAPE